MLNKKEFEKIRKELADHELKRETIIQKSREMINLSKRIIYALHRDDISSASSFVKEIEKQKKDLESVNVKLDTNINLVAFQEYAEALCYYSYIKNNKIPTKDFLKIPNDSYLMGLCDLTGELVRKAIKDVIQRKYKQALDIKNLVEEIYDEFLQFNFRNNELRVKSDQIKWNLKKLEDVVFELKLKDKLK